MPTKSPFFHSSLTATAESLAIIHLKRGILQPITLRTEADDGYVEGAVTNTRFGSFPHSTLIGTPWGSQVKASRVDTGTRGRKSRPGREHSADLATESSLKRKADHDQPLIEVEAKRRRLDAAVNSPSSGDGRAPSDAQSGYVHLLAPTPEIWTTSLSHRTQVVYVPDYSYILSRLHVKPGDVLIEAGAGSGSFTHAAARAVFNGYPGTSTDHSFGRVYSFEYHELRADMLQFELRNHGLDSLVALTHRDVCKDGFALPETMAAAPKATVIFLDLPAPWLALTHLTREVTNSPLSQQAPIRICTFSPCIEQVTATVSALRSAGWVDVQMVEVQNRRIEVRRERIGLQEEGLRGVHATASSVEESVARLREVEAKLKEFHAVRDPKANKKPDSNGSNTPTSIQSKAQRLEQNKKDAENRLLYKEGRLIHRTENEVKTHTSYLVFAVLPRVWTEQDEAACTDR